MVSRRYDRETREFWRLAWGNLEDFSNAVWKENQFAIFQSPSSSSAPPFALSPSGRFVIAGEVWLSSRTNFMHSFLQRPMSGPLTDLQLIAIAWEQWKTDTFSKLLGMFALAVWDREQQVLTLGRDRVGGRTLYYTTAGAVRWIAPCLSWLNPYHNRSLDAIALRDYLCCAFVPGERTLWQQVKELRPGSQLSFPDEVCCPFWQLPAADKAKAISTPQDSARQLRTLLDQVVQEALPSEEPVGVFLSGGLDSSGVTALAAKFHTAPVHTYSIHFGKDSPNELAFSSLVASHCQTQHHVLEITFRQMWEKLPETMACLDDPIGDPLTVPNLLLGRLAKESVNVVLNGEGGDPCFGGPKNQPMLLSSLYQADAKSNDSQRLLQAYLRSFHKCAEDLPQLLKPEIWQAVHQQPSMFSADLESSDRYLDRLMALNIKFKGADHILTKVNNLTRAAGIEGRSPLFDQRIVELSRQIPPEHKLSGAQEKAVLKQALADLLPDAILHRPKSGMMVPVQLGFYKHWRRKAKSLLLGRNAAIAPYLNQPVLRQWLSYRDDTWQRYGVKLWLIVSLELWLQANNAKRP
ncbi:MAG: asparagine synthase-related protein [Phormidesmis sp.]